MICIKTKSPISCLIDLKDICNKFANEITFIHVSVNGVTKMIEYWLTS